MPRWERRFFSLRTDDTITVHVEAETERIADKLSWVFLLRHHDPNANSLSWVGSTITRIDR